MKHYAFTLLLGVLAGAIGGTYFVPKPVLPLTQDQLVIAAVKKAKPSVVSIVITKDVPVYEAYFSPFTLPEIRQNGTERQEIGGGSGFFISSDGSIVTNRHVVEDPAASYTVFTSDGKKHKATVVRRDPVLDLAIVKISATSTPLAFADSDAIEVGQTAIAIGNVLDQFRNTVSVGVVSGLARSILAGDAAGSETERLRNVIQTDAAINPGNSGGPLLDLEGKVIGINVAMVQGSENIGFAIPSNRIRSILSLQVLKHR